MKYKKTIVFLLSFVTLFLNNVKADIGAEFKNKILNSEFAYKYPFQQRKNDCADATSGVISYDDFFEKYKDLK